MRNLIMALLAAGVTALSTGPAYADLGDQLFKLLPNDGAAGDHFASSVGITYDTTANTLWIADQFTIGQYDMAGNVLSSFSHVGDRGSLAYEAATDTLW